MDAKHVAAAILCGAMIGILLAPVAVWIGLEFLDGQHEYEWQEL